MNKKHKDNIIIIGCGRFGSTVAKNLSQKNKNVIIADLDQSNFRKLSINYGGLTKEGDGTDIDLLEAIGIQEADVLIASTDQDDINVMIAQIAKEIYHVEDVVARLYDNTKEITCEKLGIHIICPTDLAIEAFDQIVYGEEDPS